VRERYALWKVRRRLTAREIMPPEPLPAVHLRAVLVTWNEADIIATTVHNLFEQGCDAVHLLDNGSTDATASVAAAAGASVDDVFETATYDTEDGKRRVVELVDDVSRAVGVEHVWWLYVDADELVEGPEGTTVRSFLEGLDRTHRAVGSRTINHYPLHEHPFVSGEDPRTASTNAQERMGTACALGHWKHPLLRWDAAGPVVRTTDGYHSVDADRQLVEPTRAIVSHHYPYRSRAVTQARLEALRPRIDGHGWALGRREANLDAIYREAYAEVDAFDMVGPRQRLAPVPCPPVRSR